MNDDFIAELINRLGSEYIYLSRVRLQFDEWANQNDLNFEQRMNFHYAIQNAIEANNRLWKIVKFNPYFHKEKQP